MMMMGNYRYSHDRIFLFLKVFFFQFDYIFLISIGLIESSNS